ncbi:MULTISPECIES: HalOD1 output domain-containing protein [Halorussus]|uniref:HalOD1 output domain-containing protein n=1 Tax=Halorussus TaxID=1070314 RepID=UPI000E2199C4|nr:MULTISPECIES: HalOD1 output domain-containing protein [Halorussus]NHN58931.1 hypothetical protein [Halorussus sp. JP-T4]
MDETDTLFDTSPDAVRRVGDETPTVAVVRAVASVRGADPLDLPPLDGVLDPDALDRLFDGTSADLPRDGGLVAFEYCDCTVAVGPDEVRIVDDD